MENIKVFIPYPPEFIEKMIEANLSKPEARIIQMISSEILRYSNTRLTMRKEFSLRYIGHRLTMHFANVSKYLKKLVSKGLIIIDKKGKGSAPSIIRLTLPIDIGVVQNTTLNDVSVVNETTKRRKLKIKENNNVVDVFSSNLNNTSNKYKEENINSSSSLLPVIQETETKVSLDNVIEVDSSEFTPAPDVVINYYRIAGIHGKVYHRGIRDLKARGIKDIDEALRAIEVEMARRHSIRNKQAYFTTLTRDMQFEAPAGQATVALTNKPVFYPPAAPPERKTVAPSSEKTQAYLQAIEEDREDDENHHKEALQVLMEKYPEEVYNITQEINQSKQGRFCPDFALPVLYLSEFKKRYPEYVLMP